MTTYAKVTRYDVVAEGATYAECSAAADATGLWRKAPGTVAPYWFDSEPPAPRPEGAHCYVVAGGMLEAQAFAQAAKLQRGYWRYGYCPAVLDDYDQARDVYVILGTAQALPTFEAIRAILRGEEVR